jgi:hypothetical protein
MYEYIDGNGNKYLITIEGKKIIEYIPVKPHLSSSGVYNGGEYMKKELSNQEWEKLILNFNQAVRNSESHIKNRVKMSGMVIIQDKNVKKSCILKPNSQKILEIEIILQSIFDK